MQNERQRAATLAVEAAIQELILATNEEDEKPGYLMEWVVVAAEIQPDPGGDPQEDSTGYNVLMSNGTIPWHHAEGLLQAGLRHIRGDFREEA